MVVMVIHFCHKNGLGNLSAVLGLNRVARWYIFKPKITNFGKFWKALELKRLVYVSYGHLNYRMAFWYISLPFGNLVAIWYIFPRFGILCQEKSGNPGPEWSHHKTFSF
jgi:hypothetical protein